jgi:hypothetical protein
MRRFLRKRVELARTLATDNPLADYSDVVLVVTAVLSACASIRWPGKGVDRRRFVELLVKNSPEDFRLSWVSIPALINRGSIRESDTPYAGGNSTRIFRDDEIDLPFQDVRTRYPSVPQDQVRKYSYASLIYDWLRCGYAHEYHAHEDIITVPPSRKNARVSYIGRWTSESSKRMVALHLDYLLEIADYHVCALPETEDPRPSVWWLDQG